MSKETIDMSMDDLEIFFNKYNIIELESFNLIFEYVYDYEISNILEAAKKVHNQKYKECADDFEIAVRHTSFKPSDIKNKNSLLTDKELDLLYKLTDSAVMCLDSIETFDVEAERIDLSILNDSVSDEISKRKNCPNKQKTKAKKDR